MQTKVERTKYKRVCELTKAKEGRPLTRAEKAWVKHEVKRASEIYKKQQDFKIATVRTNRINKNFVFNHVATIAMTAVVLLAIVLPVALPKMNKAPLRIEVPVFITVEPPTPPRYDIATIRLMSITSESWLDSINEFLPFDLFSLDNVEVILEYVNENLADTSFHPSSSILLAYSLRYYIPIDVGALLGFGEFVWPLLLRHQAPICEKYKFTRYIMFHALDDLAKTDNDKTIVYYYITEDILSGSGTAFISFSYKGQNHFITLGDQDFSVAQLELITPKIIENLFGDTPFILNYMEVIL